MIKVLREEVGKYHRMTSELEEECGSVTACHSTHHQELEKIKDEIKVDFHLCSHHRKTGLINLNLWLEPREIQQQKLNLTLL